MGGFGHFGTEGRPSNTAVRGRRVGILGLLMETKVGFKRTNNGRASSYYLPCIYVCNLRIEVSSRPRVNTNQVEYSETISDPSHEV